MNGAPVRLVPRQLRLSWYTLFNQLPALPERTVDRWLPRLWRDWSPGYDGAEDVALVRAAWPTRAHVKAAVGYYRAIRAPWSVPAAYRAVGTDARRPPDRPAALPARRRRRLPPARVRRARGHPAAGHGAASSWSAGAGHFLQVERPDVVDGLVGEFLG